MALSVGRPRRLLQAVQHAVCIGRPIVLDKPFGLSRKSAEP
jgi:hypothetical protein